MGTENVTMATAAPLSYENADKSHALRVGHYAVLGLMVTVLCLSFAFAAPAGASSAIAKGVNEGGQWIYDLLVTCINAILAVKLALIGYQILFGSERDIQSVKKTVVYIIIGVLVVLFAPTIAKEVRNMFSGGGTWTV